jgi:hypothetical protein
MLQLVTSIQTQHAMMGLAYSLLIARESAAETSSKMPAETATALRAEPEKKLSAIQEIL